MLVDILCVAAVLWVLLAVADSLGLLSTSVTMYDAPPCPFCGLSFDMCEHNVQRTREGNHD